MNNYSLPPGNTTESGNITLICMFWRVLTVTAILAYSVEQHDITGPCVTVIFSVPRGGLD